MSQSDITPDPRSTHTTPRWVKVFAIIALVLVLLVLVVLVTGVGGEHGPGRHMPSSMSGEQARRGHEPSDGARGTQNMEHGGHRP